MLAVLLSWTILVLVSLAFGQTLILLTNKITRQPDSYSLVDTFFIGFVFTGVVISITSLFIPSNIILLSVFVAYSVLFYIVNKDKRRKIYNCILSTWNSLSKLQIVFFFFIILFLSLYTIICPQLPDSYSYHIQNIMWNEEYRVVPGLANLIDQLGFNSSFFLLNAVFGLKPLFGQYIYGINVLFLIFLVAYYVLMYRGDKQQKLLSLFGLVICLVFVWVYRKELTSPSTDILPNVVTLYLLSSLLKEKASLTSKTLLYWIVPLFCVTVKLSSFILCVFILYYVFSFLKGKQYKYLLYYGILTALVILPWLIRNVIVSGYLIYPLSAIDIFSFDWKASMEQLIISEKHIKANVYTYDEVFLGSDYILNLSLIGKIKIWISGHHITDIVIMGLAVFAPLFFIVSGIAFKRRIRQYRHIINIWLIALLGFLFLCLSAPAVRFGFGFIICTIFIPAYYCMLNMDMLSGFFTKKNIYYSIVLCIILCIGIISTRYYIGNKDFKLGYSDLYKPQGLEILPRKKINQVKRVKVNNFYMNVPSSSNFDTELPSAMFYNRNVKMRGSSLQDGFTIN